VLLFEIIFWLYLWIAVFEDIKKAGNNLLDFILGELGANPDDEAGYFGHGGLPPFGWRSNHIEPYFGRVGQAPSKHKRDFVEMTALWKVWKSLPTHFQAWRSLPTFPHFPQCLGFRFTEPTFPQSRRRLLDIDFKSKS